ncbi:hypothetical protein PYCC9005_002481 [Savitreella phatthalungensis]
MLDNFSKLIALSAWLAFLLLHTYPLLRGTSYLSPIGRPPLRMLILADPHIEGDSKLALQGWRGALDLWGNDHYLGHIHRTMRFFVRPTQTVVLGDHMSSQWIDDAEFRKRANRMQSRFLRWKPDDVVFNVSGNHDIGYAGDITRHRVNRWQDVFGPLNLVATLELPRRDAKIAKKLRVVLLNNLFMDGPAQDEGLRGSTHAWLQSIESDPSYSTILLTHIPMHKEPGICVDGPYMSYYESPAILLREQNHLSPESTKAVLSQVFSSGGGIVLSGHDHEGCHVLHYPPVGTKGFWQAGAFLPADKRRALAENRGFVEEATVRSVMGQYGGNAGLLTGDIDPTTGDWRFEYTAVPFVHNTVWWLFSAYIAIAIGYLLLAMIAARTKLSESLSGVVSSLQLPIIGSSTRANRKVRML